MNVQTTCIPPKETVVYSKQTQTTQSSNERDGKYCFPFENFAVFTRMFGV